MIFRPQTSWKMGPSGGVEFRPLPGQPVAQVLQRERGEHSVAWAEIAGATCHRVWSVGVGLAAGVGLPLGHNGRPSWPIKSCSNRAQIVLKLCPNSAARLHRFPARDKVQKGASGRLVVATGGRRLSPNAARLFPGLCPIVWPVSIWAK